jgi:hypothetical protein
MAVKVKPVQPTEIKDKKIARRVIERSYKPIPASAHKRTSRHCRRNDMTDCTLSSTNTATDLSCRNTSGYYLPQSSLNGKIYQKYAGFVPGKSKRETFVFYVDGSHRFNDPISVTGIITNNRFFNKFIPHLNEADKETGGFLRNIVVSRGKKYTDYSESV